MSTREGSFRTRAGAARKASAVFVATALVGALAGCGDDEATSADGSFDQVRMGIIPTFGTLPVEVAIRQGFFEAEGLEVTATVSNETSTFPPALGRTYDVVISTAADFLTSASNGIEINALSGLAVSSTEQPFSPLMSQDPSIQGPEDLAGKRIGVPGLAGSTYLATRYVIEQAGVDLEDVTFVATPFPTMSDQLEAGRIDAAVPVIPFEVPMLQNGYQAIFDPYLVGTGADTATVAFTAASEEFAGDADAVAAWRAAISQAIDYIESNEAEAREILEDWLEIPTAVAQNAPLPTYSATIEAADFEPWVEMLEQVGGVERVPDPTTLMVE